MKQIKTTWVYRNDANRAAMIGLDETFAYDDAVSEQQNIEDAMQDAAYHAEVNGVDLEKYMPVVEII